jgi:arylamine N-acetyltransferase
MALMTTQASTDSATTDLAAYFGRIGYKGPAQPTVETLHALVAGHNRAIPFENLDPSPAARGPRWASPSQT